MSILQVYPTKGFTKTDEGMGGPHKIAHLLQEG